MDYAVKQQDDHASQRKAKILFLSIGSKRGESFPVVGIDRVALRVTSGALKFVDGFVQVIFLRGTLLRMVEPPRSQAINQPLAPRLLGRAHQHTSNVVVTGASLGRLD